MTFLSENCLKTTTPDVLNEPNPRCPLAVVDFSREKQRSWTEAEVNSLIQYVVEKSISPTVVLVFFVPPGKAFFGVQSALQNFSYATKSMLHLEYGRYTPPECPKIPGRFFSGIGDLLIFGGVSVDKDVIWEEIFPVNEQALWIYNKAKYFDFNLETAEACDNGNKEEK